MPFDPAGDERRIDALDKIERVLDLLASRHHWCRGALKTEDGRLCILGAVREADAELELYAPILRAIREMIGHDYRHIERFNDDWLTSHRLVLEVLGRVRDRIAGAPAAAPARRSHGAWRRLRAWF